MEGLEELREFGRAFLKENPSLKSEVEDIIQLYVSEVESGESPSNELTLAKESIKQLL